MLSRLALMVQAAVLDGQFFDPVPPFDDDEGCFRCQSEDGIVMHANFQAGIAPGG
jgi:hypothetical protein